MLILLLHLNVRLQNHAKVCSTVYSAELFENTESNKQRPVIAFLKVYKTKYYCRMQQQI